MMMGFAVASVAERNNTATNIKRVLAVLENFEDLILSFPFDGFSFADMKKDQYAAYLSYRNE
jgi:hypothetical protein